jgi:hypothetical protein
MSDIKPAPSVESKKGAEISPRLIELLMEKAQEVKYWRCGDAVYENKEATAPLMDMREFIYFAIAPYNHNVELASLAFETRGTVAHAAETLTTHADDVRFPVRSIAPVTSIAHPPTS